MEGLGAWFRNPHAPMAPRWKMALLTWNAVWPVSILVPAMLMPLLGPNSPQVLTAGLIAAGSSSSLPGSPCLCWSSRTRGFTHEKATGGEEDHEARVWFEGRSARGRSCSEPGGELEDFVHWSKMVKPDQGDDMLRCNGAGETLVFSAADFEDFLEPRPIFPKSSKASWSGSSAF